MAEFFAAGRELLVPLLVQAGEILFAAGYALLLPAAAFAVLALVAKRRNAFAAAVRAARETRINLSIYFLDALLLGPPLALLLAAMAALFQASGLYLVSPESWSGLPPVLVGFLAVVAGDFVGYWRHRLEHTRLLWPSHAIHHSDTEMTWLALARFHPVSRLVTLLLDNSVLFLLGFPPYALLVNNFVRHYWGHFIHADLPWTFGPLGKIVVSPVMHRWHHSIDPSAHGTNFATIFSLIDRLFGTCRVPGPCTGPLGVTHEMGRGVLGQLAYPFRKAAYSSGSTGAPMRHDAMQRAGLAGQADPAE
jgi:sterol desaturase/sphingolipid hydroxylase (fatty acid hydroxylase superfamily)